MRSFFIAIFLLIYCMPSFAATCESGFYKDNGFCYSCPVNATCTDGETFICNGGFYKDGNICTKCPVENSTCTGPESFACNVGTFLSDGKCNACPENATCAGGNETFYCNDGWYRSASSCKDCSQHVCEGEQIISCGAGTRFNFNSGNCETCSLGLYCPDGRPINLQPRCIEGYYAAAQTVMCTLCPAEFFCPQEYSDVTNVNDFCNIGYYRIGNDCAKCPDGIQCVGTYPDNMNCPNGLYLHSNGQCLSYAENDPGVTGACNPGYYDNGVMCVKCPVENSTCTSDTVFTCNSGYYKSGDLCNICPSFATCNDTDGILCADGYELKANQCVVCKNGKYYCQNNLPIPCPEFDVPDFESLLPAGHHIVRHTNRGVWTSGLADSPYGCMTGRIYIAEPTGEYLIRDQYWDGKRYYNSRIPRLWYVANTGYYLSKVHVYDQKNYYDKNNPCTNGAENSHYTGSGTPDGNDCPWICNDGYYRDGDICKICPAGQNCLGGRIVCPLGQYADKNVCIDCPDSWRDNPNTGLESINQCQKKCDGGMYLVGDTCVNVGAGYYNPINYTNYGESGIRHQCPDNLTTIGYGLGADSESDCGKVLHIGEYVLYLRSGKESSPSLAVQYGDRVLYGSMTTAPRGHLRTSLHGVVYSIFNPDID